ncbi:MAG TPA: TetR/AcrR family transcriptional regulator [Chitinophagaceae bacterium]|jgi:TetR/AcrR family transcriptional regulator|nr:TetR/AcrR family transcriptional regulator [Chitinophagaceae bacterium]
MVNTRKEQNTEEKILAAAKKVFLKQGMAGARMQDIANEAGINKAMLHYYFRSKEKLFEKIFTELAQHFFPRLVKIFESDEPLFRKIELFVAEYIDQMRRTPYLPIFVLNEVNRQPEKFIKKMMGNRKPPVKKFIDDIQSEGKKGIIKPINPLQLLLNIISLCVFPFVARPMFQLVTNIDKTMFDKILEQRKEEVSKFIIDAIKK